MSHVSEAASVSLQSVFHPILAKLGQFADKLRRGNSGDEELEALRHLLETVPITSEEFGSACNRLKNAQRYLLSHETGAARWELDALRHLLRRSATAETVEPRRRRMQR